MANTFDINTAHLLAKCWKERVLWPSHLEDHDRDTVAAMLTRGQIQVVETSKSFCYRLTTQGFFDIYDLTMRHIDNERDLETRAW